MPLVNFFIESWGWRASYEISGVIVAATFIPMALFVLRDNPQDMGTVPDGADEPTVVKASRPAFVAIRDNDLAARAMGINLFRYKLLAFFIGCFLAGIAGSLLAHWIGSLNAEQFTLTQSIMYVGIIIIGGLGTTLGPILGVIFLRLLQEMLTVELIPSLERTFTSMPAGFATGLTPLIFGLVIILFLVLEPRGLNHRWAVVRSAIRLWPFSY